MHTAKQTTILEVIREGLFEYRLALINATT